MISPKRASRCRAARWALPAAAILAVASLGPLRAEMPARDEEHARLETTYVDAPAPARRAFSYVERIWASRIASDVPIRIRVSFRSLEAKASTVPNPVRGFPGARDGETWYPAALADALAGRDLDPSAYDMEIFFSDEVDWYYGTDGMVPEGLVDYVSVALHEVAHGLGFASRLSFNGGGAFTGRRPGHEFPELSFQVPDLKGRPTAFDRFIETSEGRRLMEIDELLERSTCLGRAVLKGELYFGGESATRRNEGRKPRLSATDPSHVDQKSYEWSRDGLMTPRALRGRAVHEPGAIVLGVLEDLGWRILGESPPPAMAGKPEPADERLASLRKLIR